jgi:NAD(P)-dependent dehydrogenase (short-subunit alcohol dehydrogenase family)
MTDISLDVNTAPVALVTGASSGIGAETANALIKQGWVVAAVARRRELLEKRKLECSNPDAYLPLPCDLTSNAQLEGLRLKLEALGVLPRLKGLVNNAGIFSRASFAETTDNQWHSLFETNFFSCVRLTRLLLPALIGSKGSIVNVSSTLGLRPMPTTLAYSASKAAMISWSAGLASELGPSGVRVNCVAPGLVDTPIHSFHSAPPDQADAAREAMKGLQPLGRIGQPSEIAEAIAFLLGSKSSWTTGAVLPVDGGIQLV